MNKVLISLMAVLVISSCTHMQSMSQTSIPKNKGKVVNASKHKLIFLLLNFDNDFVNETVAELKSKCKDKNIRGILTKYEHITYFPILFHGFRVSAEGYCQR